MRKPAVEPIIITKTWNKDLAPGATLEGRYIKKETFIGNYGESVKYIINSNGEDLGVFGSASLNRQFANIPEGSYVWIVYKGEVVSKNGRPVKEYSVDFDDEYQA